MEYLYPLLILVVILVLGVIVFKLVLRLQAEKPWPYGVKKYFFTRSEQEFSRTFHALIDHQKYMLFPKVRLVDFIEVTIRDKDYQGWWNRIQSKHVDFLIWNIAEERIVLAIELDGKSHRSEKAQKSDDFKNKLYETIGIKLVRVGVGTNYVEEIEKIKRSL